MAWISLFLAGLFEMLGVALINKLHKDRNWQSLVWLILGFGLSFIFLSYAMETLPMGTAYAILTGIGASGGAILGLILYGESTSLYCSCFIFSCRVKTCFIVKRLKNN